MLESSAWQLLPDLSRASLQQPSHVLSAHACIKCIDLAEMKQWHRHPFQKNPFGLLPLCRTLAAGIIDVLAEGLRDENERVRRRMMATLGELLFYAATQSQVCLSLDPAHCGIARLQQRDIYCIRSCIPMTVMWQLD